MSNSTCQSRVVHPEVLQENIQSVGVFGGIHPFDNVLPLKIIKGGREVPSIEIHSITDIHSCRPLLVQAVQIIKHNSYRVNGPKRETSFVHIVNIFWLNIVGLNERMNVVKPFLEDFVWRTFHANTFNSFRNNRIELWMSIYETRNPLLTQWVIYDVDCWGLINSDDTSTVMFESLLPFHVQILVSEDNHPL